MKKMNNKGFTIVELVIVIAVIAILAAVMIPTFSNIVTKAQMSALQQKAAAGFKEAYALDLSDGVLDGEDHGEAITDTHYSVAGDVYSYSLTEGGYTASFTSSTGEWTVVETPAGGAGGQG